MMFDFKVSILLFNITLFSIPNALPNSKTHFFPLLMQVMLTMLKAKVYMLDGVTKVQTEGILQ